MSNGGEILLAQFQVSFSCSLQGRDFSLCTVLTQHNNTNSSIFQSNPSKVHKDTYKYVKEKIMKDVRNKSGKLVCRLDEENQLVEIVHKGCTTRIRFLPDGSAEIESQENVA